MSNSMTGYGKSRQSFENYEIEAEIRSLNNRYLDITLRLPKNIDIYEQRIKDEIKKRIIRGKVTLNLSISGANTNGYENFKLNDNALKYYFNLLEKIRENLKLKEEISLEHILQFKDLLQPDDEEFDNEELLDNLLNTINNSIDGLVEMRQNEAKNILKDINHRIEKIETDTKNISIIAKENPKQEYDKLFERVQSMLNGKTVDENRLEMEMALIADRVDVTEECTRLESHLDQFKKILENKKEVGKSLTFILQEMHREINTIGSKTTNVKISHLAIGVKEEIEKLREQAQNLE